MPEADAACDKDYVLFYNREGKPASSTVQNSPLDEETAKYVAGNWRRYVGLIGSMAASLASWAVTIGGGVIAYLFPPAVPIVGAVEVVNWTVVTPAVGTQAARNLPDAWYWASCKASDLTSGVRDLSHKMQTGQQNKDMNIDPETIRKCIETSSANSEIKPILIEALQGGNGFVQKIQNISEGRFDGINVRGYRAMCLQFRLAAAGMDKMVDNIKCEGREGDAVIVKIDGFKFHYFQSANLLRQLEGKIKDKNLWNQTMRLAEKIGETEEKVRHRVLNALNLDKQKIGTFNIEKIPMAELDVDKIKMVRNRVIDCAKNK